MQQGGYPEKEHCNPSARQNPSIPTPKRKRKDNTKRFSYEQVKSLESIFKEGAKLEPKNKMQLAEDLGLQPRQVAIWFQNKRARWKSKKLEQEYRVLKANFDALHHQFESLKKENESLTEQCRALNSQVENSHRRHSSSKDSNENVTNAAAANTDEHFEQRVDKGTTLGINNEYFRERNQMEFDMLTEQAESSSSASRKPWCDLVSGGLIDESCCPSSWWDF